MPLSQDMLSATRAVLRPRRLLAGALAACFAFAGAGPLWAQLPAARLHWIYPPGGQRGATFDVTVAGVDLDDARELVFSHPGITAEPKTAPPRSFEKEPRRVPNQFVVKIAGDAPPGVYEVRVLGRYGLSTPRAFAVGLLPEVLEQGGNNSLATPMPVEIGSTVNGRAGGDSYDVYQFEAKAGQRVLIRCAALRIGSRMDATLALLDATGNQLAYSRDARRNQPLIDFTAPAAGKYLIRVHDFLYRGGNDYYYRLSLAARPRLDFVFPPAGVAGATGKFTLYGRNLPGGVPAEGVLLDGAPLEKLEVQIAVPAEPQGPPKGRFVAPADAEARGFAYRLTTEAGPSNPVFIALADTPLVTEQEPNNDRQKPQQVSVPCDVVGQFFPRRDRDWFSFQAKRGERFAVEVFSQRRGLPTDPRLLVQYVAVNEKGEETARDIKESDDVDRKFGNPPFDDPVRDASLVFTADADGEYRVLVRDLYAGSNPSPRHVYRLSIRPPRPDFRLLATFKSFTETDRNKLLASATILRRGGTELAVAQAYRRDGFDGPITVTATGLPEGVVCPPVVIPAGENRATLVFAAAENAAPWAGEIQIVGAAEIDGQEVRRQALGASVVWDKNNANETTRARINGDIALSVVAEPHPLSVAIEGEPTREVSRAGKLSIPVQITRREGVKGALQLAAQNLPKTIKAATLTLDEKTQKGTLEITVDPKAPVGPRSFYLASQATVSYQRNREAARRAEEEKKKFAQLVAQLTETSKAAKTEAEKKAAAEKLKAAQAEQKVVNKRAADLANAAKAKDVTVFVQSLPVTLRVVEAPISLAATAPPAAIAQGGQGEITVKIERRFEFADAVDVEVELPKNVKGVSIVKTQIAASGSAGKLVVKAAADATPGTHRATLRAKLKYNGQSLQVERPLEVKIEAKDK